MPRAGRSTVAVRVVSSNSTHLRICTYRMEWKKQAYAGGRQIKYTGIVHFMQLQGPAGVE
jgi:hypothetical protein